MEKRMRKGSMALGAEVYRDGYIKVKIAEPNVWRFKHHLVWEEANGPIPEGRIVGFIDRDRSNCRLENLQLGWQRCMPLGSERVIKSGHIQVKAGRAQAWVFKHRLIWEEANGAIPEGHIIDFIDGDKSNCCLENLQLISRHDLLRNRNMEQGKKYPIGHEKLNSFGLIIVKIAKNKWRLKHHLLWEEANGPLPKGNKGRKLIFIDGNPWNCTLENIAVAGVPLGTETIEKLSDGRKYIKVKIAEPNVWMFKHRYVWELANGPIPDGHRIQFADKNTINCNLDNLLMVSNKEAAYMATKGIYFEDSELNKTSVTLAKLGMAINEAKKKIGT